MGDAVAVAVANTVKEEPSGKLRYRFGRLSVRRDLAVEFGGDGGGGGGGGDVFARSIIVINVADGGHKSLKETLTLRCGAIGALLLRLAKADADVGVGVGVALDEALVVAIKS